MAFGAKQKGFYKDCECGCGETFLATKTTRGTKKRFVIGHNSRGKNHQNWKGGRILDKWGYVLLWMPDYPGHNNRGYVREHRFIIEKKLGRSLAKTEEVHHINGNKLDNNPQNLMVLSKAAHGSISGKIGGRPINPDALTRTGKCIICGQKYHARGYCSRCYSRYLDTRSITHVEVS